MLGAVAGDIIGSVHEFSENEDPDFALFVARSGPTDDSLLTCAVARACLRGDGDYRRELLATFRRAERSPPPGAMAPGWGLGFAEWAASEAIPGRLSFGNGAAMRVSPIAWAWSTEADVLREAENSALPSHAHPEGVRGAQATALAVLVARLSRDPDAVREVARRFYPSLPSADAVRREHRYDESCQRCVPAALALACEAPDYETTVRWACSVRGDADTLAAIAGAVAEGLHGVPDAIAREAGHRLRSAYPWAARTLDRARSRWSRD